MDIEIFVDEIKKSGLSKFQTKLSIIRAYVLEFYQHYETRWIIKKLIENEGISTTGARLSKIAHDLGIKKARISERFAYNKTEFIFPNGVSGVSEYSTGKNLIIKVYPHGLDGCPMLVAVDAERIRDRVENNRVNSFNLTSRITAKKILNLPEGHFYCNQCNTVYPRSFARQKGVHGGSKCKTCYNKQRLKEYKDPMKKKRAKIYQLTQYMITGYDSAGNAYKGLSKCKEFGKQINRPTQGYKYLGCTSEEFQQYIQGLLPEEWTLEDRGTLWELDHIEPLSNFNLMDDTEMKKAAHHTNVRPLAKAENRGRRASGIANWGKHD